jgi:hypothetical protein
MLLHMLSWIMHVVWYPGGLNQLWQYSLKFESCLGKNIDLSLSVMGKRRETFLYMCAPLCKTIVMTISRKMSWDVMHSLPHEHPSKWIPKSSMICSQWKHERCVIVGCGKPRQVHNVLRKWIQDNQNANMVGRITKRLQLDLHRIKDMLIWCPREHILEVWQASAYVGNPSKRPINEYTNIPQNFQRKGLDNWQLGVIKFRYFVTPTKRGKCWFQHVLLHIKKWVDHFVGNESQV